MNMELRVVSSVLKKMEMDDFSAKCPVTCATRRKCQDRSMMEVVAVALNAIPGVLAIHWLTVADLSLTMMPE